MAPRRPANSSRYEDRYEAAQERDYERNYDGPPRRPGPAPGTPGGSGPPGGFKFNVATVAVLAGVLILGVGIGTSLTSNTAGNQGNIAAASSSTWLWRIRNSANSGGPVPSCKTCRCTQP